MWNGCNWGHGHGGFNMIGQTSSLFSPQWYRVQGLVPRLKKHAQIHRHEYRGQLWYVMQDALGNRYHRFSPGAYWLIAQMDGSKTVAQLWQNAVEKLAEDAPSQSETIQLLGQLHGADLLASNVPPDLLELFQRYQKQNQNRWRQRLASPLAIKIPLLDPDAFLTRSQSAVAFLLSRWGFLLWLITVLAALVTAAQHWAELTENISDKVLTPSNVFLIMLIFPVVKALHELGHAYATKIWGGEVHEIGIMLLVFMPVPYVEASSASAFRARHKRIIVGAAGMIVELTIASLALFYWLYAEPGVAKTLAYNTLLIAGVSTLFFNANPLLRFDGYYMLADYLEIPNLYSRAQGYYQYLTKTFLLRIKNEINPALTPGESLWFIVYGAASYLYRIFIVLAIALFIASKFFIIGVILACWSLFAMFLLPLLKALSFLLWDGRVQSKRGRIGLIGGAIAMVLVGFVGWVPLPYWTNAEGVVWLPEEATVRAQTDCFIDKLFQPTGSPVQQGQALVSCVDPLLENDIQIKEAQLQEQQIRYFVAQRESPLRAELNKVALSSAQAEFQRAQEKQAQQTLTSPLAGRFEIPFARDLSQRFMAKGDVVGYVIPAKTTVVRAVVSQKYAALVRQDTRAIEVRRVSQWQQILAGQMQREVPGASNQLPTAALGTFAGGNIAVDPRDPKGLNSFHKLFQFDVRLLQPLQSRYFLDRVYLRFHHQHKTLWQRWRRHLKLLFMENFGV